MTISALFFRKMVDERHRQLVEHSAEKARREGERMESKRQSSEKVCQKERDRQEKAETWKHERIEAMKERRTQHQEMENSYERAAQEQESQRLVSDQETAPQRRSELNSFKIARCVAWWFWLGAKVIKVGEGRETARRLWRARLRRSFGRFCGFATQLLWTKPPCYAS